MRALRFLRKLRKMQPLLKCYRDLWLKERPMIWKVAMGAASSGVGKSHDAIDNERLAPVVRQATDRGGLFLEQDECEVGYSPRVEEAPYEAPIGKKSHKERLTMVETRLDVLEVSLEEELYQGQRRLLGVESLQEEAESQIKKVESLIDQRIENTKDSV
ncbi:hypothetical protein B296_00014021 [Ensete ventricosum]|uniref:Uncharacterized protein n=1 Tax=Ensete ventricosum TaxID=4639 RepID=A0A426ZIK5_ENSVE|nr:hypothetical protein B296_00014021 [Ensete ventricosum]